jgi:hypothetical protein
MIRNSRFYCGRNSQGLMHSAGIVPRHVKSYSGFWMVKAFTEGNYQPRESMKVHPQSQIGALHMACREEGSFRLVDAVALRSCDSSSGVELRPFGFFVTSAAVSSDSV